MSFKHYQLQSEVLLKCLHLKLPVMIKLLSGVALEFMPPETAARLLIKINIKNQIFGDIGQAQ